MNCDGCQNLEIEMGTKTGYIYSPEKGPEIISITGVIFVFTGSRSILPIGHNHIGCDILS
jgi:hypothetical protein